MKILIFFSLSLSTLEKGRSLKIGQFFWFLSAVLYSVYSNWQAVYFHIQTFHKKPSFISFYFGFGMWCVFIFLFCLRREHPVPLGFAFLDAEAGPVPYGFSE